MGTNYYLHKAECQHCQRSDPPMHIGKSSVGWVFSLHVEPELGINDLWDWQVEWNTEGAVIRNEYGDVVTPTDLLEIITKRGGRHQANWNFGPPYRSEAEFHEKNYSERGPNGLLRHRLGGRCVKHGEGTWDCIMGEFS